jgi:hypothetical protein
MTSFVLSETYYWQKGIISFDKVYFDAAHVMKEKIIAYFDNLSHIYYSSM